MPDPTAPSRDRESTRATQRSPARRPDPSRVCGYLDEEHNASIRVQDGQWVFWEDRCELVLAGRYDEVKPLHVELSPTYLCNFACPWCSCRTARTDWVSESVFDHPQRSPDTVMTEDTGQAILEQLAAESVAIQWVGGEPTLSPVFWQLVTRAGALGLQQCVFTNGSLLSDRNVDRLVEARLAFVRVSLDVADPELHREFHGYAAHRPYCSRVLQGVERLAAARAQGGTTHIGVSLVVDDRNISGLDDTIRVLSEMAAGHPGGIDYVIVRPAFPFAGSDVVLSDSNRERLAGLLRPQSAIATLLAAVRIEMVAPSASLAPSVTTPTELLLPRRALRPRCRAAGWFAEINPQGQLLACSDRYGDPTYVVGQLAQESIADIWAGGRRHRVLNMTRDVDCVHRRCPRNGRGYHLNRLFEQVEDFRQRGELSQVRTWMDDLRRTLPRPAHPFFL